MRQRRVVGVGSAVLVVALAAGCTAGRALSAPTGGASAAVTTPEASFTPIEPGPPPTLSVPPRAGGEVARVVVTKRGTGTSFRNVPGVPAASDRTYTVEVACSAGRPSTGTSYAVYDAAPGTWGHGEPLYSRPFPCDGSVQTTVNLGLPAGRVQVDVRGLPADAFAAYAVIRPE